MKKQLTYLSLGSNIGDKEKNIQSALDEIDRKIGDIISISKLYENPSIGFKGDLFFNCCIGVQTILKPNELLKKILKIEVKGGRIRKKSKSYESRTIDIDILFYENQIIDFNNLKIPHPKIQEREFVIKPLLDIAKGKIHPILNKSVLQISNGMEGTKAFIQVNSKIQNPVLKTLSNYNNIVIEGNIGIGKTSLSKKLSKDLNKNLILEGFKENPFLEKFYNNPKRYALNLELTFLVDRCRQLNNYKNQLDLFKTGIVFDYDIVKSLIFAGVTLSENDFNLYRNIFYFMTKDLIKPNLIICLLQTPDNLLLNIEKRGRHFEKKINKEYLKKINQAYMKSLKSKTDWKILFVDVSDIDFVENEGHYLELLFRIKRSLI
ncbi:MAG: 2-amino-4-hydroxy-6-hydroxymethyldihydropteridine diphosphokinase [Flavobacteriaceae bacterium]|nr:2-amino-4-hydroxy-6-hydroxymethyldihydropteridine diphosphokinase [Flavobacteriaceae bacterium]|tara:strand:+ start:12022 stop:13152 length:1131 start_codon:yes stop_codon:yes gene_type:complete